jgi:hypothetical protein
MDTGRYKSIGESDSVSVESGFIYAWLSLITDFDDIQVPYLESDPLIGDAYVIKNSHDWITGKEPISLFVKQDSIEDDAGSVGDIGGGRMVFNPKLFMIGDGAAVLEIMENLLNEKVILFVGEMPWNGTYVQYGNAHLPCEVERNSFKSYDLVNGGKGVELVLRGFCRYFYKGFIPAIDTIYPIGLMADQGFELETDDGRQIII